LVAALAWFQGFNLKPAGFKFKAQAHYIIITESL
jgi:hypothetical protein